MHSGIANHDYGPVKRAPDSRRKEVADLGPAQGMSMRRTKASPRQITNKIAFARKVP